MERSLRDLPASPHAQGLQDNQQTGSPNVVAFSPDGLTVAASSADRTRLWDVASGRLVLVMDQGSRVTAVAFSPTGGLIATAGDNNEVRLWELPSGARHATSATPADPYRCLAFSPDGRTLAAGRFDDIFAVNLWDPTPGTRHARLRDSSSALATAPLTEGFLHVDAVAFSTDGATLAAGCSDGSIRLWDIVTGELRQSFSGHVEVVSRLAFAPDGRTLASLGEDHVLNLWHLATGQRLFSLDSHAQELHGLAFSADGCLLAAGAQSSGSAGSSSLLLWRTEPAGP
jgi:WD40 repeat protein